MAVELTEHEDFLSMQQVQVLLQSICTMPLISQLENSVDDSEFHESAECKGLCLRCGWQGSLLYLEFAQRLGKLLESGLPQFVPKHANSYYKAAPVATHKSAVIPHMKNHLSLKMMRASLAKVGNSILDSHASVPMDATGIEDG